MPDDAGPSSPAAASTPPDSEAQPRGSAGSAASAPPTGPAASAPSTSATGFWSYVNAGANASVGRDAKEPPLAHFAGGGCHDE
jgi:hypothetical protein